MALHAADATSPVDPAQRNAPFAPAATVSADKQAPAANLDSRVQERRYEAPTVERKTSPLAGQRSAIDVQEARDKKVREKHSQRPTADEQPLSDYNHRLAGYSTGADTTKPPTVAKYQDSLTAASASNMARFPAIDQAATAKINRFVFRKNPAEAQSLVEGAAVVPAGGGSSVRK
jgi:hypothetical protein